MVSRWRSNHVAMASTLASNVAENEWNLEGTARSQVIRLPNVAVMVDMLKLGVLPWR